MVWMAVDIYTRMFESTQLLGNIINASSHCYNTNHAGAVSVQTCVCSLWWTPQCEASAASPRHQSETLAGQSSLVSLSNEKLFSDRFHQVYRMSLWPRILRLISAKATENTKAFSSERLAYISTSFSCFSVNTITNNKTHRTHFGYLAMVMSIILKCIWQDKPSSVCVASRELHFGQVEIVCPTKYLSIFDI